MKPFLLQKAKALHDVLLNPLWERTFHPHIVDVKVAGVEYRFFVGTPQAAEWYDPPKPHAIAEYEWVLSNVVLAGRTVVDVGAHHGHYSLLLACARPGPKVVIAIEPMKENCAILEVNAALNRAPITIHQAAITPGGSPGRLLARSNSRLSAHAGRLLPGRSLVSVAGDADVIKLDIEGAEFGVLRESLDGLPRVTSWIVEVHVPYGSPGAIVGMFLDRGFAAQVLDRKLNLVRRVSQHDTPEYSASYFFNR
jgi:FkbM family methyltransferase